MKSRIAFTLLSLSSAVHAALPAQTGIPEQDAHLPELLQTYQVVADDMTALSTRPATAAQWNCDVPPMSVLSRLGFMDKDSDPVAWKNFSRMTQMTLTNTSVDLVPLSGSCSNGQLEGPVSFWFEIRNKTEATAFSGEGRMVGKGSLVAHKGQPATDIRFSVIHLTTASSSKYVKASNDINDGAIAVLWKSVEGAYKPVPGLQSLQISGNPSKSGKSPASMTSTRETVKDQQETVIYLRDLPQTTIMTERYENNELVEHRLPQMRFFLAADGSWRSEMLTQPAASLQGAMTSLAQAKANSSATASNTVSSQKFTAIEGNTGRYLSPITSDGVAAAWVDKSINASLGSSVGGMAGAYAGQKVLEQVPFIGGFLGQKAGAAAGRNIALNAIGGDAYLRQTSDISFNDINEMAGWLVQNYRSHARFTEIMKAAGQIYPELTPAYLGALSSVH